MYAVKKVDETAVSRILYFPCGKRQPSVCATSTRDSNAASNGSPPIWSCSGRGLQRRGDHSPSRWALTPPFHPYPVCTGRFAFCCTLLPEGFPFRIPFIKGLPALWSPDFPPVPKDRQLPAVSSKAVIYCFIQENSTVAMQIFAKEKSALRQKRFFTR